jgi:hypothetical protein
VTGSFQPGMMGCGAFIPLKAGRGRRESAKQPEIRLATLLRNLLIYRSKREIYLMNSSWLYWTSLSARYG